MDPLNLLVLRCADVERSRAFYEVFGVSFSKHAHGSGPEHYAHAGANGGVIELYPANPAAAQDQTGLGFGVSDLDAVRRLLAGRGFAPGEPRETQWGRTFVVRDPDGRRVEVKAV